MRATTRRVVASAALAAVTTILSSAAGRAQTAGTLDNQWTTGHVGFHGGIVKVRDATDGKFQGGAHFELTPGRWFGVQLGVDYRSEEQLDLQVGPVNAEVDVQSLPVTLSGKLYIPVLPQFAPYGLGGAGWYHQKIDFSPDLEALGFEDQKGTAFGWHVGAGVAGRVSPRVGLFAEGRWIFLDPDRDLNQQTIDQIEDFDYNSSNLLAGINFYF